MAENQDGAASNSGAENNDGVQLTPEQLAMAEKYRQQNGGQPPADNGQSNNANTADDGTGTAKPARPDHIPEKFWDASKGEVNVEALAKSYTELEKKAAAPKPNANGETANGENADGANANDNANAESLKEFAGLRQQATDLLAKGEPLTDEVYAGLEKHGLSRDDVDAFIAGQEALGQLARYQVHGEAGGEEQYKSMIEWARANYSAEEVQIYDRDIHSGDPNVRLAAVRGLKARYSQANGEEGRSVTNGSNHRTTDGYESGAQMRADMKNPKYQKDAAFRAEVARKVAAARAAGVDLMAS